MHCFICTSCFLLVNLLDCETIFAFFFQISHIAIPWFGKLEHRIICFKKLDVLSAKLTKATPAAQTDGQTDIQTR